jgi:Protein of unknown function (DUF2555)
MTTNAIADGKPFEMSQRNAIPNLTTEEVEELALRLESDDYGNPFDGLKDWHFLRAIAFQRPDLVEPYIHLLDLEAYDEA